MLSNGVTGAYEIIFVWKYTNVNPFSAYEKSTGPDRGRDDAKRMVWPRIRRGCSKVGQSRGSLAQVQCTKRRSCGVEIATSALKKRTDGNSTKLNTHMNEMTEKMDLLKARVQEVEDDHAETRSKLESLKDWIEDQLDHMRHERRHRGTEKRTPPSNTPTAEDGDELARRVMAHKQERAAKMRGSRMLEELSEVSGTSAPVTTPTMSTTGTMGRRRSRCRAAAAFAASAVHARS